MSNRLSLYTEFAKVSFLQLLAYRLRYLTGILTYTIFVSVYYFLWHAVYGNKPQVGGYSFPDMVTYVAVGWISRSFFFNNIDVHLTERIRNGDIALDMLKPVSMQIMYYSQAFGESIFRVFFFTLPIAVVVFPLFGVGWPASISRGALFLLSLALGFFVNAELNYVTGLVAIYTTRIHGIITMKRTLVTTLSGLVVPLSMFPSWLERVVNLLPFRAIVYIPLNIYQGRVGSRELVASMAVQCAWIIALGVLGTFFWAIARRKLTIVGG